MKNYTAQQIKQRLHISKKKNRNSPLKMKREVSPDKKQVFDIDVLGREIPIFYSPVKSRSKYSPK